MPHLITLSTCNLNQWALDFDGNRDRIIRSIIESKKANASLRVGPELEITGYGCLDHFLELDLYDHSWDILGQILKDERCQDILIDVGMPVLHNSSLFNCRVVFYNKKILLIRPKMSLANDGNFREQRYFTAWEAIKKTEMHMLPPEIQHITGQKQVTFGDAIIEANDTTIGIESCEELFTPEATHIRQSLAGAEIFVNSSGSHHELRKLNRRMDLILEATLKSGGAYLYANSKGCDGDRLYYDGCAMVLVNGEIKAQGSQFSLRDVEIVTATVDLDEVRSSRLAPSRRNQTKRHQDYPRVEVDLWLALEDNTITSTTPSPTIAPRYVLPEEEIALGPACWLWDYLRRSRAAGFFLPLSGGIDSCSTAVIVHSMCRQVVQAVNEGNEQVETDLRRIAAVPDGTPLPSTPQQIASRIFHTSFMGTTNSSSDTRSRAKQLAKDIGAYHVDMDIDAITNAITSVWTGLFGVTLKYKVHGGSQAENIALQNIQARIRMVVGYLFAQTLPFVRKRQGGGGLLVLGSANVDESLRGYLTKYDCSSADINPIGGISKTDLKRFISWAELNFDLPILRSFIDAVPTAELEPITETYVQSDEADMGMTYDELSVFGRLRKVGKLGPWGMYRSLLSTWGAPPEKRKTDEETLSPSTSAHPGGNVIPGRGLSPREIYEKVRRFFYYYSINRHKMTTLTPSYHAEQYSPDDNRFDLRPFLYPGFSLPYRKMMSHVEAWEIANGFGPDGKKVVKGD